MSDPLLAHLPHKGPFRGKVEYSPEDYAGQYSRLWRALKQRAEAGRATIVLGGDIHEQSVKTALDQRLLEIVSSPLALLESLDDGKVTKLRDGWRWMKGKSLGLFNNATQRQPFDHPAFPLVASDGSWQPTSGKIVLTHATTRAGWPL